MTRSLSRSSLATSTSVEGGTGVTSGFQFLSALIIAPSLVPSHLCDPIVPRFMVSAPDRPMKSAGTLREAANKLVTAPLPLYMACPCR